MCYYLRQHVQCIYRNPKECKERHKILMDGTTGDGIDSVEDSGSSQPYPSTLPGIPKAIIFIFSFFLNNNFSSSSWQVKPDKIYLCLFGRYATLATIWVYFNFVIACWCWCTGQCQTIVSTFAGANGRRYGEISFWENNRDFTKAALP